MKWLNDFNSTNGKIFAGILMAIEVVTTVCIMQVYGKHFNEILLLEILAFIAAWAGISYAQFAKKRDTFKPALPADEDGPHPEVVVALPSARPAVPLEPQMNPEIAAALEIGAASQARTAAGDRLVREE